jgi:phosphoesterase RecJ-like protein
MTQLSKNDEQAITRFLDFADRFDNFMISGHISADGDAIAACLGVAEILRQRGKRSEVVLADHPVDPRFRYLAGFNQIRSRIDIETGDYNAAVIVDTPGRKRLGSVAELLPDDSEAIFRIDHHPGEGDLEGAIEWENRDKSSTALMVYEIASRAKVDFHSDLANILISGIIYDTGRFAYRNTKSADLKAAAHLLEAGANIEVISQVIFFNYRVDALRIFGKCLEDIALFADGQLAVIFVDHEKMNHVSSHEIEDLATYASSVRGALAGAFIREQGPGLYKSVCAPVRICVWMALPRRWAGVVINRRLAAKCMGLTRKYLNDWSNNFTRPGCGLNSHNCGEKYAN